ncbi:MAG: methionine--tRNA ligase [Nanoarchaeota archaeon]|nr:methionine--tRNA ligase [Nanoarchaeota archaeon]MBU4351726.1 methionine--tRNA ligase [Nanoarchaeota archaeon]MBU4456604.1 methionine--tRNA ligase [Nanoarchaeota archaeon]MCG2719241.1 methionine--tRNA ligase [Nanoarchaeota archaeon]
MKKEKRLITAALPYTNNVPHIGNIVGSHFPADIFARFCRLIGHDTVFVGGTDEHGTASEIAAQKYGITPKELSNFYYKIHKEIYDWFEISYDNFSQTSRPIHHKTTQEFLKKVYKNGYITEKTLELPFCKDCQRQLADRFIEGICPHCGYEKARGDQCEHCSKLLDPIKLKKPYCAVCKGKNIEFKKVKHLFFELNKLESKLKKWITSQKHWRSQVKGLALGWIKEGLKPRCITRDLKWGVQVPFKGYEHFIFYVWVDAPIGYISSTKEWDPKKWKQYWQGKDSKIYHFVGKDNIPFHTIFFPGMLMANGDYNLPYNVVGLQYLNYEGSKFSKSKGFGVFCENLPKAGLDADYWRFYLSYLIPETRDTEFFWKEFQERVNTELVGNFGNFVNRTLSFLNNKFKGVLPEVKLNVKDKTFIKQVEKQVDNYITLMDEVKLKESLEALLHLSSLGNKYFQDNEPWKDLERAKTIISNCSNLCLILGLLCEPFLPNTSKKILRILNIKSNSWDKIKTFKLKSKHKINKPELLFNKLEDKQIKDLQDKTSKVTEYFKIKETKKMVSFEEFQKLDLRIGKVLEVKPHPDADKLYVLQVDLGELGKRQIVAGLKQYYEPKDLKGKEIVVVANLQPVKLRGVESQGMLLAATDDKNVAVLSPEKKMKEGAKIS